MDSDKVAVRYIDFGNAEELPGSYVVPLDREFRGLPYHVCYQVLPHVDHVHVM